MVDSNIYREKILPSEKAFAYKMKMAAIKHQGKATSDHDEQKLSTSHAQAIQIRELSKNKSLNYNSLEKSLL